MVVTVKSLLVPLRMGSCRVFLDGVGLRDCFYADTVEGLVRVYERDSQGRLVLDRDKMEASSMTLYGDVVLLTNDQCEMEKSVCNPL